MSADHANTAVAGTPEVRPGIRNGECAFGLAAAKTCAVVGTALTLINHPEIVRTGLPLDLLGPTLLNYLVPFLVSGYSRSRLLRRLRTEERGRIIRR